MKIFQLLSWIAMTAMLFFVKTGKEPVADGASHNENGGVLLAESDATECAATTLGHGFGHYGGIRIFPEKRRKVKGGRRREDGEEVEK